MSSSQDTKAPFKIVIIGCGLAGGLLANGLLHANIDFDVYESAERDSARAGYQIRLGAPALRGFKACLDHEQQASLYKKFGRSGGVISSAPILYDAQLNELLDLTKFPAYTKSAPINRVVLRDFLRTLPDAAGRVKYGKKFTGYKVLRDQDGRDTIRAQFLDGTVVDCDLLISAEGSRSVVNRQIGLDNIVQLTDTWSFLAKGTLLPGRLEKLDPLVKKSPVFVVKDGVSLFYSAYLPDAPANSSSEHEPRCDNMGYDVDAASLFWGLNVPVRLCPESPRRLDDVLGFCIDKVRDWNPRIHEMLRATDSDDIHVFQARVSTEPAKNWRSVVKKKAEPELGHPQVWLLGDAIHPMLPARGMGGNQAMCDTADLLPQLVKLDTTTRDRRLTEEDYVEALGTYEGSMLPRAFGWVKESSRTSDRLVEPTGLTGKLMFFFAARVLDVLYLFNLARTMLGFKPVDDAVELPN
ncbi:hypothetical protein B0I37DRAFT_407360 [Chaetomium sp. MPI-CAGE-AT-0009]|nr:hypothetical protein B0I37DRAFT_407360 [Chaetomium sp. MPI-CAGE-AT-0009]